jgi:hypothetical protein
MIMLFKGFHAMAVAVSLFTLMSCKNEVARPQTTINMEPFIAMAKKTTVCAERANKLFAIDDSLVFWQREGDCNDASYGYMLFGSDTGTIFCSYTDNISGRIESVKDSAYLPIFQTIVQSLNDPKLGLGSSRRVIQVTY